MAPPPAAPPRVMCLVVARCDTCGDEIVAVLAVSRCVHCHRRTELRARLQQAHRRREGACRRQAGAACRRQAGAAS